MPSVSLWILTGRRWVARSPVWVSLWVPTSGPLVRIQSWDKFILCCSPTLSFGNWMNANSCIIIYNFCFPVSEKCYTNQSDTLSFTAWQTGWNCWHKQLVYFVLTLKKRCNMKPCIFLKKEFLSLSDRSHHYERSKICSSLWNLIIWHFPTAACLLLTCRISFCSNIFCMYVSLILITVDRGNAYLLLILKM